MFEDRTQEQIKSEILSLIDPETGLSALPGGYADATVGAAALQVSELYKALPAVVLGVMTAGCVMLALTHVGINLFSDRL